MLCVYVLCTVMGSWVATPPGVFGNPPKQGGTINQLVKSKLLQVESLPDLSLLALRNATHFYIFFLKEVEMQV